MISKRKPDIIFTDPLGYIDFQKLLSSAKLVITDSGGIQEEATVYKIPCITLRDTTERPITVSAGSNMVVGRKRRKASEAVKTILNNRWKTSKVPKFWDGKTAERIIKILLSKEKYICLH
jgi:UDP-N-acetylglucosamine 2-epimerase (non-hydrolysing)